MVLTGLIETQTWSLPEPEGWVGTGINKKQWPLPALLAGGQLSLQPLPRSQRIQFLLGYPWNFLAPAPVLEFKARESVSK